jgi:hypothetical protein
MNYDDVEDVLAYEPDDEPCTEAERPHSQAAAEQPRPTGRLRYRRVVWLPAEECIYTQSHSLH